ncbi:hypothetical protein IV102_23160 [bacterium]|nr:hypothetical protein [bacterium]
MTRNLLAWAFLLWLLAGHALAYTPATPAQQQEIQAKLDEVTKLYGEYLRHRLSDLPWDERKKKMDEVAKRMTLPAQQAIILVDLYYSLEEEGKNAPHEPIFHAALDTYGATDDQGNITIGPLAFESLHTLVHTKLHEFVHADQVAQKRFPKTKKERLMVELEAYYHELQQLAAKTGIGSEGIAKIEHAIYVHETDLGEANLERVHSGNFVAEALPLGEALETGKVSIKLEGKGVAAGTIFVAHLKRLAPDPFLLEIAGGTALCPDRAGVQTMMVGQDVFVPLTQTDCTVEIPGFCLDPNLPPPPRPEAGAPPIGWAVASPCDEPTRFFGPKGTIQAGRKLSAAGQFHTDMPPAKYRDTVIQRALWFQADPAWNKARLQQDLQQQVEKSGGGQTPEQVQKLTDHLWDDVDLTIKSAKRGSPIACVCP